MPPESSSVSARGSAAPLIQNENESGSEGGSNVVAEKEPKTSLGKRLFGLGKSKEEKSGQSAGSTTSTPELRQPASQNLPISPARHPYPSMAAAVSPSRLRSSSPRTQGRTHSPASSEIFERNVQEPVPIADLQADASAASHIPTHVTTEDHIPPALDATAEAITSESLNADEVEIVMSSSHQPAAASVLEGGHRESLADVLSTQSPLQPTRSDDSESAPTGVLPPAAGEEGEGASTYGQLDPNDVRRLSFISFADVVQSEHQQMPSALDQPGSRDSLHIGSISGSLRGAERASSPLRSPPQTHSGGVTTPPLGSDGAGLGHDVSPGRVGSPFSQGHGDLTVQTMRQAVRKTASGDLGRAPSAMSPGGSDGNRSRAGS